MKCDECGTTYNDSYKKCPKCHEPSPMQAGIKKCPFCAETIKAEAIKCRFCQSDLTPQGTMETPPAREEEPPATLEQEEISYDNQGEDPTEAPAGQSPSIKETMGAKASRVWGSPRGRKAVLLAAGAVLLVAIAVIIIAVATHKSPQEVAVGKAVETVRRFLDNCRNGDYEEAAACQDTAGFPLLKAIIVASGTEEDGSALSAERAAEILNMDDTTFVSQIATSLLPSLIKAGETEWGDSGPGFFKGTKSGDRYAVMVKQDGGAKKGLCFVLPTEEKVDVSGMAAFLYPGQGADEDVGLAVPVAQKAEEWMGQGTRESCSRSVQLLDCAATLESKYEFFLSEGYREYVASTGATLIEKSSVEKARKAAADLKELLARAGSKLDGLSTVDDLISVDGPAEGADSFVVGASVPVTGTVKEAGVKISLGTTALPVTDGKFSGTFTMTAEGPNKIQVTATSRFGKAFIKEITVVGQPKPAAAVAPAPAPAPTTTTVTKESPEYKCACINVGYEVKLSDPLVTNFRFVFDSLQSKFPSKTRMDIADIVCAAKERIDTTTTAKKILLEVAHGINNNAYLSTSLEEVAALYIGMVRNGAL